MKKSFTYIIYSVVGRLLAACTQRYPVMKVNIKEGWAGMLWRIMNRTQGTRGKPQMKVAGKMREGGTDESMKATMTKCGRREQGERENDRRGSTRWTAGPESPRVKLRMRSQSQSLAFICGSGDVNMNQLKHLQETAVWSNFYSSSLLFSSTHPSFTCCPLPSVLFISHSPSCQTFLVPNLLSSTILPL